MSEKKSDFEIDTLVKHTHELFNFGRFEESKQNALKLLKQEPSHEVLMRYIYNLFMEFEYKKIHEFVKEYKDRPDIDQLMFPQAYLWDAIAYYLENDFTNFSKSLKKANGLLKISEERISKADRIIKILYKYMIKLERYRLKNPELYDVSDVSDIIYFIGDSHSLSAANIKVNYKNKVYKTKSLYISGIKIFHLNQAMENVYTKAFSGMMDSLPEGANVVLTVGEIDCRADEGIMPYLAKNPGVNGNQHIIDMINNASEFIMEQAKKKNINIIHHGVPGVSLLRQVKRLGGKENTFSAKKIYNEMQNHPFLIQNQSLEKIIAVFNFNLAQKAQELSCDFLDIFKYTNNLLTEEPNKHHIDSVHLYPHVTADLLCEV